MHASRRIDEDVERGLDWFLGLMERGEWERRRAPSHEAIQNAEIVATTPVGMSGVLAETEDKIGLYLCLAEAFSHRFGTYDHAAGARVIPSFKRLGMHIDLLERIEGATDRAKRILGRGRETPDNGLFELLVGLLYARNGCRRVAFIPEEKNKKTADLSVAIGSSEWEVECKRLSPSSEVSSNEQRAWDRMWSQLEPGLIASGLDVSLDIIFHQDVCDLEEDFLLDLLIDKLRLAALPGIVADDDVVTIHAARVDMVRFKRHMAKFFVRDPSPQLDELVIGSRDSNRKMSTFVRGERRMVDGVRCLSSPTFACGAAWCCDSEEVTRRKARSVGARLKKAANQLSSEKPGAVHIGIETSDGGNVERVRFDHILRTMTGFDAGDADLRFAVVHLYHYDAPPDMDWQVDETSHLFLRTDPSHFPLKTRGTLIDEDAAVPDDSIHWAPDRPQ